MALYRLAQVSELELLSQPEPPHVLLRMLGQCYRIIRKDILPAGAVVEEALDLGDGQRFREEEPLSVFAAENAQLVELMYRLYTLGDDLETERLCECDDGANDLAVLGV